MSPSKGMPLSLRGVLRGVASFKARANSADDICWKCLFKDVMEEAKDAKE